MISSTHIFEQSLLEIEPLISDYLVEEVLKKLPKEFQKYLMKTSLLDRFCADVVDALDITESTEKEKRISGVEFIEWLGADKPFCNTFG